MKKLIFGLLAAVCLLGSPAFAQQGANVKLDASQSASVTTSAASCVAAQNSILTLFLFNAGSNPIWYRPADGTEPVANAAGSSYLAPNQGVFWPLGTPPRGGLHCIAVTGASNLSVYTGQ